MGKNNLCLNENKEDFDIPFSDKIEFEDGFICDVVDESDFEGVISDYVLEKILWNQI